MQYSYTHVHTCATILHEGYAFQCLTCACTDTRNLSVVLLSKLGIHQKQCCYFGTHMTNNALVSFPSTCSTTNRGGVPIEKDIFACVSQQEMTNHFAILCFSQTSEVRYPYSKHMISASGPYLQCTCSSLLA